MILKAHRLHNANSIRIIFSFVALGAAAGLVPETARGESLKEALTAAYLFNPILKAARAQTRATDNQVAQAKSGYRPTITATLQDGFEDSRTRLSTSGASGNNGFLPVFPDATLTGTATPLSINSLGQSNVGNGVFNPRSAQIALQQNVFDGFRTYNAVKGAEAQVEASREDLRTNEENVLLNAATAYMNVVRDQAQIKLQQNNIKVLSEQLRATQDRFKVGEVTRTDVAQAESGLANAQAGLSITQGTLYGDTALFIQFIGHPPGTLKDPGPPTKLLPKTLEEAIAVGNAESPLIIGAIFRERAQAHTVKQLKGQLLPTVTLNASYTKGAEETPGTTSFDDTRVFGNMTIPLYEAGSVSAQIRAAIETQSALRQQLDIQREQTRANVTTAWGLLFAARGNIASGKSAVESSRIALQGVREEERVGQRTILDVLAGEQTSLNAQVLLVSFQRDLVVASYSLLSGMGRLTAYDISLQAELYDPTRYYGEVKDLWYGWGASVESREDPIVPQVRDPGRVPGQKSSDGPAYTQKLPSIP